MSGREKYSTYLVRKNRCERVNAITVVRAEFD